MGRGNRAKFTERCVAEYGPDLLQKVMREKNTEGSKVIQGLKRKLPGITAAVAALPLMF